MVATRYHAVATGWKAAEFGYTPFHWQNEHRFIAVRRPAALEPEDIHRRLSTFKRYTCHWALVTNLDLTRHLQSSVASMTRFAEPLRGSHVAGT